MKKILILTFILLYSCVSDSRKQNYSNISFSDNLSFNDFISKLNDYVKNSPYPNIDD